MYTALHSLAQLIAVATAAQFAMTMILHFRVGRQKVRDGVRLAAGLSSLAIHAWLCMFPESQPRLWQLGAAAVLLVAANRKFWIEVRSTVDGGLTILGRAPLQGSLATIRPFGLAGQPYYVAYMLGLGAFAFLGLHSFQCITLLGLAFMYDDDCRRELGTAPVDIRWEAAAAMSEAWESVPKQWRSTIVRARTLAIDVLRRSPGRSDETLDTLPLSMLEQSPDRDDERDGVGFEELEATNVLALGSRLTGSLSITNARRLFPSNSHDQVHVS